MSKGGRTVIATGLVMLSVVGWATAGEAQNPSATPSAGGDVQALRERAAAFWAARLAGDSKGQWELLEPRGRGRLTPQEYAGGPGALRYLAYQVEDATINGYFATVRVRLMLQPLLPSLVRVPVQTVVAQDSWIRVGGVWYHSLDDEEQDQSQGRRS
jgi:hypothetical protein